MIDRIPSQRKGRNYLKIAHNSGQKRATWTLGSDYYSGRSGGSIFGKHKPTQDFRTVEIYIRQCIDTSIDCHEAIGLTLLQLGKPDEVLRRLVKYIAIMSLWAIYEFGSNGIDRNPKKARQLAIKIKLIHAQDAKYYRVYLKGIRIFKNMICLKNDGDAIMDFAFSFIFPALGDALDR